jgi:hypothetical protein
MENYAAGLTSVSRTSQRAPRSRHKSRCTVPGAFFSVLHTTHEAPDIRESNAGAVPSAEAGCVVFRTSNDELRTMFEFQPRPQSGQQETYAPSAKYPTSTSPLRDVAHGAGVEGDHSERQTSDCAPRSDYVIAPPTADHPPDPRRRAIRDDDGRVREEIVSGAGITGPRVTGQGASRWTDQGADSISQVQALASGPLGAG